MSLSSDDFYTPKILEGQLTGMIKTKRPGEYSARLRIPVGILTSEAMRGVAALAEKYGRGEIYLTARLGIEIPGVQGEDFPSLREELAAIGVATAGCGPRMRSVVSCKGTVCPRGNVDTFDIAWRIDEKYNDAEVLPHKFKIAVAGCASTCSKPQVNDVGLVGVSEPDCNADLCMMCNVCVDSCQLGALKLTQNGPVLDHVKCVYCGDCIKACPAGAFESVRTGLDLFAGGRWGRRKQVGIQLASFLTPGQAFDVVGEIKEWCRTNGDKKERLGAAMLRAGVDEFQRSVLAGVPKELWVEITPEKVAAFQIFI